MNLESWESISRGVVHTGTPVNTVRSEVIRSNPAEQCSIQKRTGGGSPRWSLGKSQARCWHEALGIGQGSRILVYICGHGVGQNHKRTSTRSSRGHSGGRIANDEFSEPGTPRIPRFNGVRPVNHLIVHGRPHARATERCGDEVAKVNLGSPVRMLGLRCGALRKEPSRNVRNFQVEAAARGQHSRKD
jgi:hypothetical protein